jgi:hypothetical protein
VNLRFKFIFTAALICQLQAFSQVKIGQGTRMLVASGSVESQVKISGDLVNNGEVAGGGLFSLVGSGNQSMTGTGTYTDLSILKTGGIVTIDAGTSTITSRLRMGLTTDFVGLFKITNAGNFDPQGRLILKDGPEGPVQVPRITGTILSDVIVQRYIPMNNTAGRTGRAWRLLSIPVKGVAADNTLTDFFMGGQSGKDFTTVNPASQAGVYGFPVVGHNYISASAANAAGFDWIGVANQVSSIRYYAADAGGGSFASTQVPDMTTKFTAAAQGYMAFIRGDRQRNYVSTSTSTASTAILASKGRLNSGTINVSLGAKKDNKYALVGNPFIYRINLKGILFDSENINNIENIFYVWDANLATQGGYRSILITGSDPNNGVVTMTPNVVGSRPDVIEIGTAFFVMPKTSAATVLKIKDNDNHLSNPDPGYTPLETPQVTDFGRLSVNLEVAGDSGRSLIMGGVLAGFRSNYRESLGDELDIEQMNNVTSSGIWLKQSGKMLAMEGRNWPSAEGQSVLVGLSRLGTSEYIFRFIPAGMSKPGLKAYLKDNQRKSLSEINLNERSEITFRGSGSAAADSSRFEIVFNQQAVPPVKFLKADAEKAQGGVSVKWQVSGGMAGKYEVERSADKETFASIAIVKSRDGMMNDYNWLDEKPLNGIGYYRIKSTDAGGMVMYSPVVRVNLAANGNAWNIYPNPSKGTSMMLQLEQVEKGRYGVKVIDAAGREVSAQMVDHSGGAATYRVSLPSRLPRGTYFVRISDQDGQLASLKMLLED